MANEITFTASLSAFKAAVMAQAIGRSVNGLSFTMNGTNYAQDTISVPTTGLHIPLGQCRTPHWAYFNNLDSTNYLTIRYNATGADLVKLYAGEPAFFPLVDNQVEPTMPAVVAPSGGGSSGGNLPSGNYNVYYTMVTATGLETTIGNSAAGIFFVPGGSQPLVTFPAIPTGFVSYNLYITDTNAQNPRLYSLSVTGPTFTITNASQPLSTSFPPPPIGNTVGPFAIAPVAPVNMEYMIFST